MKVYRGVYDITPEEIDPNFIGQGSFGEGTYYAFDEDTALAYCFDAKFFGILYEAEIELDNNLELHSEKVSGLRGYRGDTEIKSKIIGTVDKEFLTDRIRELGFSAVSLKGAIDGGEQIIVLDHSVSIKITYYKVVIHATKKIIQDKPHEWTQCNYDSNYMISKKMTTDEIIEIIKQINLD